MLSVAASGYVVGLASGHLQHPSHLIGQGGIAHPLLPMIGVLLAPFLLYQGRPDPMAWARRIVNTAARLLALLGLVLIVDVLEDRSVASLPLWLTAWFAAALPAMLAGRALLAAHIGALRRRGLLAERVAIVGAGPLADWLATALVNQIGPPVEVVGVFGARQTDAGIGGTVLDLVEHGKRSRLDRLFVVVPNGFDNEHVAVVETLKALNAEIVVFFGALGEIAALQAIGLGDLPLARLARRPISGWGLVLKALLDRGLGSLLLICVAPLMASIALAIRLDSPGPVIFRQYRHGLNNAVFEVFKFRTMSWQGTEAATGATQTVHSDPRVTRIGHFLRRTSLDELPQLLNVLRGEMSLVGPRPLPVAMLTHGQLCHEILANYGQRHRVKPGITGFAQIHDCRGAVAHAEELRHRVQLDLAYINRWSLLLDLKILGLTPLRLLFHHQNAF